MATTQVFRAVDLSTPRGLPPRNIGMFATLSDAQGAAESEGVPSTIFEGYHLRGYTSGKLVGRKEYPNQGFRFDGCPCGACQS